MILTQQRSRKSHSPDHLNLTAKERLIDCPRLNFSSLAAVNSGFPFFSGRRNTHSE
jgi:hypothetical protein